MQAASSNASSVILSEVGFVCEDKSRESKDPENPSSMIAATGFLLRILFSPTRLRD